MRGVRWAFLNHHAFLPQKRTSVAWSDFFLVHWASRTPLRTFWSRRQPRTRPTTEHRLSGKKKIKLIVVIAQLFVSLAIFCWTSVSNWETSSASELEPQLEASLDLHSNPLLLAKKRVDFSSSFDDTQGRACVSADLRVWDRGHRHARKLSQANAKEVFNWK